jgi:hypothetical protein
MVRKQELPLRLFSMTAVASLLMFAGFSAAQAHPIPSAIQYECPASQHLIVQRDNLKARVSLAGQTYVLERHRSSIGDKYLSQSAALIIDGGSAVFVAKDHLDLGTCVRTTSVASSD